MEKVRMEKVRDAEDKRWRRSEREKVRQEKMQVSEKVGKSRNTVFSDDLWLRSKSTVADAEPAGQRRDEHLHAVVA